jgi:hypothetical protein
LPCIGALHPDAVAEALAAGASDVLLVACPAHDCSYREGSHWLEERSKRRPVLRQSNVHLVAAAPGDRGAVLAAAKSIRQAGSWNRTEEPASNPVWAFMRVHLRPLVVSLAALALIFGAAIAANRPASAVTPQQGQLRIAINHHGQLLAQARNLAPDVVARLPAGVDPALVLGGERFPVQVRVLVDGLPVIERAYRPGGLRREGSVYGIETWWLAPGAYLVEIGLMEDGANWRTAFAGRLTIASGQAQVLVYDASRGMFAAW